MTVQVPSANPAGLRDLLSDALASNTKKAYASDWRIFDAWCKQNARTSMPATPETIALYATARAEQGAKWSTIQRNVYSIATAHHMQKEESPCGSDEVKRTLAAIRRRIGTRVTQKAPVLVDDLKRMVQTIPATTPRGLRDRAILIVGFWGAFRRSEIIDMRIDDITVLDDRVEYDWQAKIPGESALRRQKTEQTGGEVRKTIEAASDPEICPVRALRAWLGASGITKGYVFQRLKDDITPDGPLDPSGEKVQRLVQRAAQLAGLDPKNFGGHSLRAGFVTQARIAGYTYDDIASHGHWSYLETVRRYDRRAREHRPRFTKGMEKKQD